MRKNLKFLVPIFAILAIGMLGMACSSDDDYECTGPDDCTGGQTCSGAPDYVCEGTCNPSCTGKCGGPDGCDGTCPDTCTGGQVCSGTPNYVCEDPAGCTPENAVQCSGTTVQTCTGGSWVNGLDCANNGEICVNGACEAQGTCTNGATQCLGTVPQTCVSEAWVSGTDCANSGQICVSGACEDVPTTEECPTSQACTDLTDGDGFMGCTEGGAIPGTATACQPADGCDGNFVCAPISETEAFCVGLCGTCPSGQTCDELIDGGASGCLDGGYIPDGAQTDCGENSPCVGNAMCYTINEAGDTMCIENCSVDGPCNSGDVRCDGDVVQSCQAGVWVDGTDCSSTGETCYAGTCASADLCPTGRDCEDITAGDGSGVFACLEASEIPGDAPNCDPTTYACPGNMSCWNVSDVLTCLENCGTCEAALTCTDITVGDGSGVHACLDGEDIPASAPNCDPTTYACPGNMSCWNVSDVLTCLGNCSIPH